MPEGHVIHRLAGELNSAFADTTPDVSSPQGRFAAEAAMITRTEFINATAVGKHLFLHFDAPQAENIIHIHLGLIGTLRFEPPTETTGVIRLRIANDQIAAQLRGPQWCRLITQAQEAKAISRLGADPLLSDADPKLTNQKVARSRRSIASLLMDQKLYAGVGNIYRAETLFRLGINPFTPGNELTQIDEIWVDLTHLMADGVANGRIDTVRPEHTPEAMERPPRVDDHGGEVYVYRRAGQPCLICGTTIEEVSFEGRNLFYCPTCQHTS